MFPIVCCHWCAVRRVAASPVFFKSILDLLQCELLRFAQMDVIGDPNIDNPSKWGLMFNPQAFKQSAAFTPRTNPKWFPGILGPGYKNMDLTLAKFFKLTERFQLELKMESYNVSNTFTGANPDTTVTRSTFGRVTAQATGINGREFQYNLKLHF